jgi:hypothetical protein
MFRQQIDEAPNLGRKVPTMGVNGIDRMIGLQKPAQNRNQTAGFDFIGDQKRRRQRESLPMNGGEAQRIVAVGLQVAPTL